MLVQASVHCVLYTIRPSNYRLIHFVKRPDDDTFVKEYKGGTQSTRNDNSWEWLLTSSTRSIFSWLPITEIEAKVLSEASHPFGHTWDPGSSGYAGQNTNIDSVSVYSLSMTFVLKYIINRAHQEFLKTEYLNCTQRKTFFVVDSFLKGLL